LLYQAGLLAAILLSLKAKLAKMALGQVNVYQESDRG
jgi:hypothetical protein